MGIFKKNLWNCAIKDNDNEEMRGDAICFFLFFLNRSLMGLSLRLPKETSAPMVAWKCFVLLYWEIMTDQPTGRPNDGQDGVKWKLHKLYTSNNREGFH